MKTQQKKNINTKKNKKISNKKQSKKITKIYKNKGGALLKSKDVGTKIYVRNINADIITVNRKKFTIKFMREGENIKIVLEGLIEGKLKEVKKILENEGYINENDYLKREDESMEEKMDKMNGIMHFIEGYLLGGGYKKSRSPTNELPPIPQLEKKKKSKVNSNNFYSSILNTNENERYNIIQKYKREPEESIYSTLEKPLEKPLEEQSTEELYARTEPEYASQDNLIQAVETPETKPVKGINYLNIAPQKPLEETVEGINNLNIAPQTPVAEPVNNTYMNVNEATPESIARVEGTYENPTELEVPSENPTYLEIPGQ